MLPVVAVMGRAPNKDMKISPYMIPAGVCKKLGCVSQCMSVCVRGGGGGV